LLRRKRLHEWRMLRSRRLPRQRSKLPKPDQCLNLFEWGLRQLRRCRHAVLCWVHLHRKQDDLQQRRSWRFHLHRMRRPWPALLFWQSVRGRRGRRGRGGSRLLRGLWARHGHANLRGHGQRLRSLGHVFARRLRNMRGPGQSVLLGQSLYGSQYFVPGFFYAGRTVQLRGLWWAHAAVL